MRFTIINILLFFSFLFPVRATAQITWSSPELEQMYRHAQEYVALRDYKNGIATYKQAIVLAPAQTILYKELGWALYLSRNYKEAEEVLVALTGRSGGDAECYQLLARSQWAVGTGKRARATIEHGLRKFPTSGALHNALGVIYEAENKHSLALESWQNGIAKDPGYSANYAAAAISYLQSEDVLWGLLYGEMFLCMRQDTEGAGTIKGLLFEGYKKLFAGIARDYNGAGHVNTVGGFDGAVMEIFTHLTPVISDGITTENLTMMRTRFLLEWVGGYEQKYPFTLFAYYDKMAKLGLFDQYNEWLSGEVENRAEYDAWNKFHTGEIAAIDEWLWAHPLRPAGSDNYRKR